MNQLIILMRSRRIEFIFQFSKNEWKEFCQYLEIIISSIFKLFQKERKESNDEDKLKTIRIN